MYVLRTVWYTDVRVGQTPKGEQVMTHDRPTVSIRPLRRRPVNTTAVVHVENLPRSPPKLTGLRRAQMMDVYVTLLEESHRLAVLARSTTQIGRNENELRFNRVNRVLRKLRRRLGR